MASFALYKRLSARTIRKDAKDMLAQCQEFFKNNPRRRVAYVGVWYGKTVKVRKNHIKEDVDAAAAAALK